LVAISDDWDLLICMSKKKQRHLRRTIHLQERGGGKRLSTKHKHTRLIILGGGGLGFYLRIQVLSQVNTLTTEGLYGHKGGKKKTGRGKFYLSIGNLGRTERMTPREENQVECYQENGRNVAKAATRMVDGFAEVHFFPRGRRPKSRQVALQWTRSP